jgi:hypothetical protein
LGGEGLDSKPVKEFFYLDVSVPFNTQELSWQDLSNINMPPPHLTATSVKGGANNNTLFLYGGSTDDQNMALVYTFDSQSIVWNIPNIGNIAEIDTIRKWALRGIINYNGRFYLWSGFAVNKGNPNEMLILDTLNLNWERGSLVNAPNPRSNYGATLLPNNKIIYLGKQVTFINLFLFFTCFIYFTNEIGGFNEAVHDGNLNIIKGAALTLNEVNL